MMLMPRGINAIANPCNARATISTPRFSLNAPISDPITITPMLMSIILRLPNISARRDIVGMATTLEIKVAVISHDALSAVQFKMPGIWASNGMNIVCMIAMTMPDVANTAMVTVGEKFRLNCMDRFRLVNDCSPRILRGATNKRGHFGYPQASLTWVGMHRLPSHQEQATHLPVKCPYGHECNSSGRHELVL